MKAEFLLKTACMDCGATWWKKWPEDPGEDNGTVQNHGLCDDCDEKREKADADTLDEMELPF